MRDDDRWIQIRYMCMQRRGELVPESCLSHRNKNGTTDCLRENDDRKTSRNIGLEEDCLCGEHSLLKAETNASSSHYLVSNPNRLLIRTEIDPRLCGGAFTKLSGQYRL